MQSLPNSNISAADIQAVFDLPRPVMFSDFYSIPLAGVPTHGSIDLASMMGKEYVPPFVQPKWVAKVTGGVSAAVTCLNTLKNRDIHAYGIFSGSNLSFYNSNGSLHQEYTGLSNAGGCFTCVLSPEGVIKRTGYITGFSSSLSLDIRSASSATDDVYLAIPGNGTVALTAQSDPSTGAVAVSGTIGTRTAICRYNSSGACTMFVGSINAVSRAQAVTVVEGDKWVLSNHVTTNANFLVRWPSAESKSYTDNATQSNSTPNLILQCSNANGTYAWDARITSPSLSEFAGALTNSTSEGFLVCLQGNAISSGTTVVSANNTSNILPLTADAATNDYDAYLLMMSTTGIFKWCIHIKGNTGGDSTLYGCLGNTKAYACGGHGGNADFYNADGTLFKNISPGGPWVICTSLMGQIEWVAHMVGSSVPNLGGGAGATTGNTATAIYELGNGDIVVVGNMTTNMTFYNADGATVGATVSVTGGQAIFVVRYNSTGTVLWATSLRSGSTGSLFARTVITDTKTNNTFYVGGSMAAPLHPYDQYGNLTSSLMTNLMRTSDACIVKYGF